MRRKQFAESCAAVTLDSLTGSRGGRADRTDRNS